MFGGQQLNWKYCRQFGTPKAVFSNSMEAKYFRGRWATPVCENLETWREIVWIAAV